MHILDPARSTATRKVAMCGVVITGTFTGEVPVCSRCVHTNRANGRLPDNQHVRPLGSGEMRPARNEDPWREET